MVAWWRKIFSLIVVAAALAAGPSTPVGAISLEFDPTAATVAEGGTVGVQVWLRGLGVSGVDTGVGAYDVFVRFDDSLLAPALTPVTFGTWLNPVADSTLQLFEAPTLDTIWVTEASLLSSAEIVSQPPDVLLFTLFFDGLLEGTSPLTFFDVTLSDESGLATFQAELVDGNVTVTQTVIPEPGTLLLLGSGLAGLACRRRRSPAP